MCLFANRSDIWLRPKSKVVIAWKVVREFGGVFGDKTIQSPYKSAKLCTGRWLSAHYDAPPGRPVEVFSRTAKKSVIVACSTANDGYWAISGGVFHAFRHKSVARSSFVYRDIVHTKIVKVKLRQVVALNDEEICAKEMLILP